MAGVLLDRRAPSAKVALADLLADTLKNFALALEQSLSEEVASLVSLDG